MCAYILYNWLFFRPQYAKVVKKRIIRVYNKNRIWTGEYFMRSTNKICMHKYISIIRNVRLSRFIFYDEKCTTNGKYRLFFSRLSRGSACIFTNEKTERTIASVCRQQTQKMSCLYGWFSSRLRNSRFLNFSRFQSRRADDSAPESQTEKLTTWFNRLGSPQCSLDVVRIFEKITEICKQWNSNVLNACL